MARQEIEVKARVSDADAIIACLRALGAELSAPVEQDDMIFRNFLGSYTDLQLTPDIHFVRLRQTGGKTIFTIKKPQTNELDVLEYETEIADAEQMKQALLLMGYQLAVRVKKIRRKANYQDYEICLDEVEGLGSYIEVEKLADGADSAAIQSELFDFLMTLGIKVEDREQHGYDTLVYLKQHAQ